MNTRIFRDAIINAFHDTKRIENILDTYKNCYHKCCLTCRNFDEPTEMCVIAGQKPPARIIAFGCPKFEDLDEVPF